MGEVQLAAAVLDQRDRVCVHQKVCDEASAALAQNPGDFGKIITQRIGEEMSKNGGEKYEIERIVRIRKAKVFRTIFALRVVKLIVQVSDFKVKVGITAGNVFCTPRDAISSRVKAVVFTLG